jgi:hypothetical protein
MWVMGCDEETPGTRRSGTFERARFNLTDARPGAGESELQSCINVLRTSAAMQLHVILPKWLAKAKWKLGFAGLDSPRFALQAGTDRELSFELTPGQKFTDADVDPHDRDITIAVEANGISVGGVTYRFEPKQAPGERPARTSARAAAKKSGKARAKTAARRKR